MVYVMNNVLHRGERPHEISHPIEPSSRQSGSPTAEAGADEAMASAKRSGAWKREVEMGRRALSLATPSDTIDLISSLPMLLGELYIVIEEHELKRPLVLQSFPKPGLRARQLYDEAVAQPPELVPVKKRAPRRKP